MKMKRQSKSLKEALWHLMAGSFFEPYLFVSCPPVVLYHFHSTRFLYSHFPSWKSCSPLGAIVAVTHRISID